MSNKDGKRFSLLIRNQSPGAYEAYKSMTVVKNRSNSVTDLKSVIERHRINTGMKYPFGLTENRFRWQQNDSKHQVHHFEITGSLSMKKRVKENISSFEDFYRQDNNEVTKKVPLKRSASQQLLDLKKTSDNIFPKKVVLFFY